MKPEKQLYQWDVNQYLTGINPAAQYVDYQMGNEVIRIKSDGTRCRIPDEVLQTYGGKTCYERYPDGTYRAYSFTVLYAPKPPDYVYTPEERTTFEALTARVDASIEEIKRRADSGEFTPVKGVDYFTDAEKNEMMESVSSGAVGEFRKVADTATTEYNDNHNLKLEKYNANAAEKLTTYDTNAEQHTTDYNRNAAEKLEAYNSNHTAKVAEYNQNAETKTAEFDANAAALQTEVDRLRGECDTLAAENRKQENRISALLKLNKGQTYDIFPEEGETVSRTAPSGAKYVSVDKVGGKSIVWNQLVDFHNESALFKNGELNTVYRDGKWHFYNYKTDSTYAYFEVQLKSGHKYFLKFDCDAVFDGEQKPAFSFYNTEFMTPSRVNLNNGNNKVASIVTVSHDSNDRLEFRCQYINNSSITVSSMIFVDITQMFGAGNEPTAEQFEAMFPADSYPYNPGEIISAKTATITAGTETITTGFPELKSAGTAHDVIDMDGGKVIRNVYTVELETLVWNRSDNKFRAVLPAKAKVSGNYNTKNNELCNKYEPITTNELFAGNVGIATNPINGETVWIFDSAYETPEQLVASLSGAVLHYELATPTTEPVTIPEPLQEWLPVEPGGTVTFRNADESKQLPVPNAVSWVRKLNEVE